MELKRFLVIVNKVTSYHRHGIPIPKKALDNLSNAQLEMEKELKNTSSNSDYAKCSCCVQSQYLISVHDWSFCPKCGNSL